MRRTILYSEEQIAKRVGAIAHDIAVGPVIPHLAAPILTGGYVFAADLMRALVREGISLPTEFLWLRSYMGRSSSKGINVLVGPNESFRGKNVLIVDGVLDGGHTMAKARDLVLDYGASAVITAVVVDKLRPDAVAKADHAGFMGTQEFIVGYGMDDSGSGRALPYMAIAE